MKIGIFTDTYTPEINGVVSSIVTLQKGLEEKGHEVYIITSHKGFLHATHEGNVYRMPGLELKWLYGYILSTPYHMSVKAEIEKLNLDVIHVHTEFGVGIFGRIVARLLRIPVVYTYHTMYEDYTHYINKFDLHTVEKVSKKTVTSITRFLCSSVTGVIAPSEKTLEKLQEYGVKRPIYIIPTGLDMNRFKQENVSLSLMQEIRDKYGIQENDKLITYVGRIAEEKSIDIVVDGAAHIQSENCKIMIVGGGPDLDILKERAEKLGVEDKVIFTGPVSRDEVPAYYLISDAFVSASITETQGMTFIEALASGLAVFARKDEVLEDLIEEDKTGYYFEDAQEFAFKVDTYLNAGKEKHDEIREQALNKVSKYDVDTFVNDVLSAYQKAMIDYGDYFNIKSIKSNNECMKLYLESNADGSEETLLVSLDDYLLYNFKKEDMLEHYIYDVLKEKEAKIVAYRMCIKKLSAKDRTRKEMYDFLINQDKVFLNIKDINRLIETLEEKGFINDEAYMVMSIDKMNRAMYGKGKIIRKLVEKGIPYNDIEKALVSLDEDSERIKIEKLANKYMMTVNNKSIMKKKEYIVEKLHNDGYSREMAKEVVHQLNFEEDYLKESILLEKTVDKAYKNYSKKYSGKDLRQRVLTYALRKGFLYDDIKHVIDEREDVNE